MLERLMHIGMLYDFYGALLTEKQRSCLEMHYLHDLSLSEIAEEFGISRQAVHDILRRAEHVLLDYENALKLVERYQNDLKDMQEALDLLESLPADIRCIAALRQAENKLSKLINR